MKQEDCDATHPGFTVTCKACGSTLVYVDSDVGFSVASGQWGDVSLSCANCSNWVDVWPEVQVPS